ncbi:glycosyltransferase family 2 protein [Nitrospira lenta]|uniref:Glycosyl transferase n=1 Tax=Nitrospira lenta TaxID=1436998 RepID=A0A330L8N9_9BACT|nr:glycosyltransferase family 2 protein [Nitrospira lenta]SPP65629.1 Glycosyl transferase [Nitrospira lenta]
MPEPVPVSVVVPCWRCGATITRAVESIATQTRWPREVILVDDASGDDTVRVLQALVKQYPRGWIKVIAQPENGGPGVARNAGWDAATSRYIAFLDADDAWHPRKLEMQVAWMESHPEAVLTGTQTTVRDTADKLPALPESFEVQEITFRRLLFVSLLPTRSVMIHRGVPNRFVPGKRYSEDYLLWLSILAEGSRAFLLGLPLAYSFKADFGAAGLSSHLWRMHCEVLDTYRRLHRAGYLSGSLRVVLTFYALLKFCRRVVLSRSSLHSFC